MADVPPPPDATQPLDQFTPVNALRKLSASVQTNDRAAIAECLCDDGADPDAAAMARAFFLEQASVWRLQQVWETKFTEAMNPPGLNFDDFPGKGTFEMALNHIVDFPGGLDTTIDGNIAKVRVPLPKEDFLSPGPDALTPLGHWSGAMLVLKQVDGNWKLDTDRTFDFLASVARHPGNNKKTLAIQTQICTELVDGLDGVSSDIESGKIATRQRTISGIEAAASRAFRDAHVDGAAFMTLPLVGG